MKTLYFSLMFTKNLIVFSFKYFIAFFHFHLTHYDDLLNNHQQRVCHCHRLCSAMIRLYILNRMKVSIVSTHSIIIYMKCTQTNGVVCLSFAFCVIFISFQVAQNSYYLATQNFKQKRREDASRPQ
jgi:hypothetical protein